MLPKGSSKRAAANKKAVAPKKPSAPKKIQFSDMTIPKNAPVLLDDNGFVVGSKEANWALLKKSGNWFTLLDDEDVKDAEQHGVIPGSNTWVELKTPQQHPPRLSKTRELSTVRWDFPSPKMVSKKRSAGEAGPPAKRTRRAALAAEEVEDLLRVDPQTSTLGTNLPAPSAALGRGRRKATNTTTVAPPALVAASDRKIATPKGRGRQKAINSTIVPPPPPPPPAAPILTISSVSSALSSLGDRRTPTPPPEFLKAEPSPTPSESSKKRSSPSSSSSEEEEEEETPRPAKRTRRSAAPTAVSSARSGSPTPGRKGARGEFPCEKCTKSFGRVEHLERHVKSVHDKVKEHQCEGCKVWFSRKDNLKQHHRKCGPFLALENEDE